MNMPDAPELAITDLFVTLWRRRIIAVVSFLIILGTIAVLVANRPKTVTISALITSGKLTLDKALVRPDVAVAKLSLDFSRAISPDESSTNIDAIADNTSLQVISNELIELHTKVPAPLADSAIATINAVVNKEIKRQDAQFNAINEYLDLRISEYQASMETLKAKEKILLLQIEKNNQQIETRSHAGEDPSLSYSILENLTLRQSNISQRISEIRKLVVELNIEKQQQLPMKFIAEPAILPNRGSLSSFMIMLGGALFAACVAMLLAFLADALARARTLCNEHERPPSTAS